MRLLVALAILALAFGETCGPDFGLPGNFTNANEHAPPMPRPRPGSALVCNWEASVSGLPRQCCCVAGLDKRCLPHVIIAGAQKSGSTALFGYLLFHPNFAKPSRKEVHAFDNRFRWSQDIGSALRSYLQSFEPFNPSKVRAFWGCACCTRPMRTHPYVTVVVMFQVSGEASPSYILGYDTAKIIGQVVPDSKVIVLLRNPVDRFYSE